MPSDSGLPYSESDPPMGCTDTSASTNSGKNDTGTYSVTLFDFRGRKISRNPMGNCGLIRAQMYGENCLEMEEAYSFIIERVINNSLDKGPW